MKRILLLGAMLGLMGIGMTSAMGDAPPPPSDDIGACRWYCNDGSRSFRFRADCEAACGPCEQVC
jgi:hypothetical protein